MGTGFSAEIALGAKEDGPSNRYFRVYLAVDPDSAYLSVNPYPNCDAAVPSVLPCDSAQRKNSNRKMKDGFTEGMPL